MNTPTHTSANKIRYKIQEALFKVGYHKHEH